MSARADQVNLRPNPSFDGGSDLPSGWNGSVYPGTSLKRATDYARTGRASGDIDVAAASTPYPSPVGSWCSKRTRLVTRLVPTIGDMQENEVRV